MNDTDKDARAGRQILASGRIVLATMAVCCLLYGLVVLSVGQALAPERAEGSLLRDGQGNIVGSELLAQGFSRPEFFWPRPSAVDYNAAAAGGSNLSPANPELRARVLMTMSKLGAEAGDRRLLPADLVTASGSGLDPHITLTAARYQAGRVAAARGLSAAAVSAVLDACAKRPGGMLTPEPLVNVLQANMALNRMGK